MPLSYWIHAFETLDELPTQYIGTELGEATKGNTHMVVYVSTKGWLLCIYFCSSCISSHIDIVLTLEVDNVYDIFRSYSLKPRT